MSTEIKPLCVVRAPVACRAGYGDMSRDIIRHLIEWGKFDVKVHSVPWGDTPMNALDENNPKDTMIIERILTQPLNKQPDLFVSITVPNEFEPHGKFNIGITAGIETTIAAAPWIEGCNKMNLVLATSVHSAQVLKHSKYSVTQNGAQKTIELTTPIEVLHNCIDNQVFGKNAPTDMQFTKKLDEIPEQFCFAFVGHWLRGDYGEDRKNVGMLVKLFLETFRQLKSDKKPPALILKTSSAGFSIMDREEMLKRINEIRSTVQLKDGETMPNVYLLHGDLTDKEMNTLYNHPKVKAHITLTKGEGFGRPLLEASVSGKPIIASGWSGHLDFLNKDQAVLIGGELKNVHPSSAWENVILTEASWFTPDQMQAMNAMAGVFMEYSRFKNKAYDLGVANRNNFSYDTIKKQTIELMEKHVPEFPKEVPLVLPKLKKIEKPKLNTEVKKAD